MGTKIVTTSNATDLIKAETDKNCIQEIDSEIVEASKCGPPSQQIILWYKKSDSETKLFNDARKYCDDRGWRLFGEYDGTQAQTDLLFEGLDFPAIYLGIERKAGAKEWITETGIDRTTFVKNRLAEADNKKKRRRILLRDDNLIYPVAGTHAPRKFICVILD